jgi:hypothetical protein
MRRVLAVMVSVALASAAALWTGPAARGSVYFAERNGDIDANGQVELADAILLMKYLFVGGETPVPVACEPFTTIHNGDANGNGTIDVTDPIYMLNYLFLGGPEIVVACE